MADRTVLVTIAAIADSPIAIVASAFSRGRGEGIARAGAAARCWRATLRRRFHQGGIAL